MLPSTGLFKSFACPYFDSGECTRPYCHFKHVRKGEPEPSVAAVPEYTPTPKLLTLPQLPIPSTKKKKKLEYQPEKPEINAPRSKKQNDDSVGSQPPVYIPAPTGSNATQAVDLLNLDDCVEELDELNDIIDDQLISNTDSNESKLELDTELKLETEESARASEKKVHVSRESKAQKQFDDVKVKSSSSGSKDNRREKERRDSNGSSSSTSKRKPRSSAGIKEKNDSRERKLSKDDEKKRDRDRDKEQLKEKERTKEKKLSPLSSSVAELSSSSSKHKSSSSSSLFSSTSKSSGKNKHQSSSSSSSSSKNRSSSSSSSSTKKHHHQSSSSSSSSKTHKRPSSSTSSSKSKINKTKHNESSEASAGDDKFECDADTETLFATTEEDIMKECEMIYDQLEEQFASLHQDDPAATEVAKSNALKRQKESQEEDEAFAAAAQKKQRVAYENADKFKTQTPLLLRKPNHIRNAMQAIFNRQSVLQRKQEEEATAAEAALRDAEERVRKANEELRKAKEKQHLTPLIPKSYLTPPSRPNSRLIAPVANMIALERAKKKVEELKAEKRPAFTPAQTVKGTMRMAHKATAALATIQPEKKPKPPVLEANSTKISFNIRMQYYEMMVKHCLAIYPTEVDAWERAQTEELVVFKKCSTPMIYKSSALLTINKLRKEAVDSGNKPPAGNKIISHEVILAGKLAQNTSWSVQKKIKSEVTVGSEPFDKLPGYKSYDMVYELRLTDDQLACNGFPRAGKRPGTAVMSTSRPMRRPNETERYCSRCGKSFSMDMYDEVCVDECNYHPKSTGYRRGFADNQHRCCQQPAGTPGCTYANYHVSDYIDLDNLTGYVTTMDKGDDYVSTKKDIYALDCEMCYTTKGIELTRVTVVDINARIVYDAFVKPDNKIVDYNTIYSGITEQTLINETRTLRDVQAILMSMFHSRTVLVGHSLDSDLKALKLIHSVVVDTSVLFPHKMGPPKKRALKTLCIENLKRIIQESEHGHDSAEDAEVCIQLVKFYLRNKIS